MDKETFVKQFTVILLGDGGVGKTTYIKRYIVPEEYRQKYFSNYQYEVTTMIVPTNMGTVKLRFLDTAGQERLGGLRQNYFITANAAIIMFDLTARITYKNIARWYKDMTRIHETIPIVFVGNKLDSKERKVKPNLITFPTKKGYPYCQISGKANYNWQMPLLHILRTLMNNQQLYLTSRIPLCEPMMEIDLNLVKKWEAEWQEVQFLPSENEDF